MLIQTPLVPPSAHSLPPPELSPRASRIALPRWAWWTLAVGIFAAVMLQAPSARLQLYDFDMAVQTAGGQQIATGEHPFVHWRSTYGPLRFYISAFAQFISGDRLGSELLVCGLAYALIYLLLFDVARRLSGSWRAALAATLLACLLMPRFHKYFILLGPALALHQSLVYLDRPRHRTLWLIAAGIALAALSRLDFGAWSLLGGAVAIELSTGPRRQRLTRATLLLPAATLACASPWLLFLLARGALSQYLVDSTVHGMGLARGLSLPWPAFNLSLPLHAPVNLTTLAFASHYALFLAAILLLISRSSAMPFGWRPRFAVAALFALCVLTQSFMRSDLSHLLQGITLSHVLMAPLLVLATGWLTGPARGPRLTGTALLMLTTIAYASSAWVGHATGSLRTPGAALADMGWYLTPRADALPSTRDRFPDTPLVPLLAELQVQPPGRLLCIPYLNSIYTLSSRPFASGQMYLAPGYFDDPAGQQAMIDTLRRQGLPPVVEQVDARYDGLATRSSRAIAPQLFALLEAHYTPTPIAPGFILWRSINSTAALR